MLAKDCLKVADTNALQGLDELIMRHRPAGMIRFMQVNSACGMPGHDSDPKIHARGQKTNIPQLGALAVCCLLTLVDNGKQRVNRGTISRSHRFFHRFSIRVKMNESDLHFGHAAS